jgi:N-acetylneuraminic acid mutarotase
LNFLSSVEVYNPEVDKWEFVASMNTKRSRMALVTCNGRLYAFGGYDGQSNLNSVEFYCPDNNQWTLVKSMIAHEGVVGVGVLPIDIEYNIDVISNVNDQQQKQQQQQNSKFSNISQLISNSNQPPVLQNNHYALMEEEEDENQYRKTIKSNFQQ